MSKDSSAMTVREIYLAALDIEDDSARQEFLDEACGVDAERRRQVEQLMEVRREGLSSPLDEVVDRFAPTDVMERDETVISVAEDTMIGPYKIREQIGEGGFGVVYVAEQIEPVQRKVALKIIKPGMDTKEVIGRFQAEQQALAMMDHPHIAKVFDAGTTETGRPYFVMELIRGMPITKFCREKKLDLDGRLKLFIDVCKAVQHAHQKGIIHRDLKPSNVMITLHDGTPVVKVIDFGVAKALSQKLTAETVYTRHTQMIGTPAYMSPEQAELSGLDIDTRSDVYSLGVLLYETLTGVTPFEQEALLSKGFDEMRRIIREDDPPRPSHRISTLNAEALSTLEQERGIDGPDYSHLLKRELDWIVMKTLEKDRERRYESANALAADVQRYLNDEPVLACPPTLGYRLRKSFRRQKGLVASASLILLTAIVGIVVSLKYANDANESAEAAVVAKKEAEDRAADAKESELQAQKANAESQVSLYTANMKLASDALVNGDVLRAEELLQKYADEENSSALRGFEWHYFQKLVSQPCLKTIQQIGWVEDVEISPDGRWLATTSSPGRAIVYETTTWEQVRTYTIIAESINGLAWSNDSEMLAAACANGQVHIWNFIADSHKTAIDAHDGKANDVVFTADGKELISCGDDNLSKRWDIASRKLQASYKGHEREVERIALSPDGRLLATASSDLSFAVWEVASAKKVLGFDEGNGHVVCVAFSMNGQLVAAGTISGSLYLMNVKSGETTLLTRQVDGIEALTFMAGNRWLATTDRGGAIQLHPIRDDPSNEHFRRPRWMAHHGRAISLTTTRDGKGLISGGRDGAVHIWRPELDGARWDLCDAYGDNDFALRGGNRLYRAGHKIEVWDLKTRRLIGSFAPAMPKWDCIAVSADERFLSAARIGELVLFDRDSKQVVEAWKLPPQFKPYRLAISPDGNYLAVGENGDHKTILLYQRGGVPEPRRFPARQCFCLTFSPDSRWLAAGHLEDLRLFDLQEDYAFRDFKGHSYSLNSVTFTPDSRHLATVSGDRLLKLWNIKTGEEVFSIAAHQNGVRSVAITPDGQTIATAGEDNFVKLWHTATGQPLGELPQGQWSFSKILFSSDGLKLVGQSGEDMVVYDASERHVPSSDETEQHIRPLFTGLGDLPGGPVRTIVGDISANGRFVVGQSFTKEGFHAFKWSLETGMQNHADLADDVSQASGISDDGRLLCGSGGHHDSWSARIWTTPAYSEIIAPLHSHPAAMTPDGTQIVGEHWSEDRLVAFHWTGGQFISLPGLSSHQHSLAVSMTPDGKTILGFVFNATAENARQYPNYVAGLHDLQPVLWTSEGTQVLEGFDKRYNWRPYGVSDDGTVIVGIRWPVGGQDWDKNIHPIGEAFRWENGRVMLLGNLPGFDRSAATDVSGDGSIVVGRCVRPDNLHQCFIWERESGLRGLSEYLAERGANPAGWALGGGVRVSQDGSVFAGDGRNPAGDEVSWYARVPRVTVGNKDKSVNEKPAPRVPASRESDESKTPHFVTLGVECARPELTSDGNRVVGETSFEGEKRSFLWNRYQGLRMLPLPEGFSTCKGTKIDENAKKILARIEGPDKPSSLVTWSIAGSNPKVIEPPADWRDLYFNDVEHGVIVGYATDQNLQGHPWKLSGGKIDPLPRLEHPEHVTALILSKDGKTTIGAKWSGHWISSTRNPRDAKLIHWRQERVEELAGFSSDFRWRPLDVSADASVIVGRYWNADTSPYSAPSWPFRWENGKLENLGTFNNEGDIGVAEAVSADGNVVVGYSVEDGIYSAFIWDRSHGLRRLADVFQIAGGLLYGWQLEKATSISDDGTYIAGVARDPDGRKEGYVLKLPAAPSASAAQSNDDQ